MIKKVALMLIKGYKLAVSPYLPSSCIYQPTCSDYTAEAIQTHGVPKGSWMGMKRIARCNPFSTGGLDLVPSPASNVDERSISPTNSAETLGR